MASLLLVAGLAAVSLAAPPAAAPAPVLALRALPNSPSGNYTPAVVDCPSERPTARSAAALSTAETDWLALRRNATFAPLVTYLEAAGIAGFDASSYLNGASQANVPSIGLAVSGGGYRALMNGAGFLAAADSRSADLPANGSIAGLLQAATYLAGLSGGGWLVGSMFANNFSTIETLRNGYADSNLWRFDNSIFTGPSEDAQATSGETRRSLDTDDQLVRRLQIVDTAEYWTDVARQVATKADAGYETSLTDYWGRALSYQLINAAYGGLTYTFSSIADTDDFASGQTPFPILVADGRAPNTTIVSLNATVFEFNAFEMGSWDPTTFGFVPTAYIGSNFSNGEVPSGSSYHCVRGFDQFGFVMGTSSTLFNQFLLSNLTDELGDVPSFVISAIENVLEGLGADSNDIAQYVPNPFRGFHASTNAFADNDQLTLVDGGEDLQNIPLHPLIQPLRALDVIVAVDSSADTDYNWPNGTALRATYERSLSDIANGTLFPSVPDDHTFINLGLNQRPVFFGCNASNFSLSGDQSVPPLVVYLPNAPYTYSSNVSTFTPSYTIPIRNAIIENGFNSATQGNGTVDANWPACLACAVLSRSFDRTSTAVPDACTACFEKYCWDGSLNTTDYGAYEPGYIISNNTASATSAASLALPLPSWRALAAVGVSLALLL